MTNRRCRGPAALLGLVVLATISSACGGPAPSIPMVVDCGTANERAPGALPALEALLPRGMIERSPDLVDSGWNCTADTLGTYAAHGVETLRFAGATWDYGNGDATAVVILGAGLAEPEPLEAGWVEEFYTVGALNARHTDDLTTTRPTMPGAGEVFRLEALNDLSLQTVVVWPAGLYVHVVIVATTVEPGASRAEHNQRVEVAVEVAAAVPSP